MIISHSEGKRIGFRITNKSKRALHVMTELWCEEFDLEPGDVLEGSASLEGLADPHNPLNLQVFLEDEHVSLWCPYDAEFKVQKADEK